MKKNGRGGLGAPADGWSPLLDTDSSTPVLCALEARAFSFHTGLPGRQDWKRCCLFGAFIEAKIRPLRDKASWLSMANVDSGENVARFLSYKNRELGME